VSRLSEGLKIDSVYRSVVEAPVVADVDVLVAGGGTAGCVAALAAARNGAEVLLVERYGYLGGMMTEGHAGLTMFMGYPGDRTVDQFAEALKKLRENPSEVQVVGGIPLEIANRLIELGAGIGTGGQAGTYVTTNTEAFKALLFSMMEEAGVMLLLHSWIADVIVEENALRGVVVENKSGRQALLAKVVVDATGDGDVAAKAGAPYNMGVGPSDISAKEGIPVGTMQGMGKMYIYGNVDVERLFDYLRKHPDEYAPAWTTFQRLENAYESFLKGDMFVVSMPKHKLWFHSLPIPRALGTAGCGTRGNGLSAPDLTKAEVECRKRLMEQLAYLKERIPGFEDAYLMSTPPMFARETRHILGEYVLTVEDLFESREFGDGIGRGGHPIDSSPVPESLKKRMWTSLSPNWSHSIPYRSLVPLKVNNLLVAGKCISATHEAYGCIRPTAQCMVIGQAAGTAAALSVKNKVKPRHLDIEELRKVLKEQGVIL